NEQLPHRLYLFYANRVPEAAAFLDELKSLAQQNLRFKLIATMSEERPSRTAWNGEKGRIDRTMLMKYLGKLEGPVYYIAGPPGMVASVQQLLNAAGIDDDDIRSESFSGYETAR
ncbi:MAG TPA: oxidoreductase, partial [Bacteroidota bacterium]|nr:oxidoreductase [Bacteroidota bacterium]